MERFRNEVNAEELAMLQRVLDDYCVDHDVTKSQREDVAMALINLFTDDETIRVRLERFLS